MTRRPGGDGAAVAGDDRVIIQELVERIGGNFRLHRRGGRGTAILHQLHPVLHVLLRLLQEAPVLLALEQGKQRGEDAAGVADQPDLDWMPQPNARGIDVDLHGLGLSRLWQELHIGEVGARP